MEAVQSSVEQLKYRFAELAQQAEHVANELYRVRRDYLAQYHIPEYLVSAHREMKMNRVRWRVENFK